METDKKMKKRGRAKIRERGRGERGDKESDERGIIGKRERKRTINLLATRRLRTSHQWHRPG